jgi:hypothetical protein
LTSAIAVVSALTPSWAGLTFVRASSDDFSAATSAQAVVGAAVVAEVVVGAVVVAGGLVWLGPELVPQLVSTQSRATARTAANSNRRWSCIYVFS